MGWGFGSTFIFINYFEQHPDKNHIVKIWLLFLSIEVLIALGTATLIAFFSYNSPGMDFYPPNS